MRGTDVLLLEPRLRGALEPLFRARAAHDFLTLAEAEASLRHAKRLPELFEVSVESLDLVLDGRVEPLGEPLPQHLAFFRELLDLGMYLVRCHVG